MAAGGRRSRFTMKLREGLAGYGFLSLNFCGFLCLTLVPVVASIVLAFCYWDLFHPPKFVGLANFKKLLLWHRDAGGNLVWNDPHFWKYLYNTCFLMARIPVCMLTSLALAMLLSSKVRGKSFWRAVYFLPSITAGVAIFVVWKWIYDPQVGPVNWILKAFGLANVMGVTGRGLLGSVPWAKPGLMFMGYWGSVGGMNMVLYLAALANVPQELYEAAEIDGASGWQRFVHITWPMITPTTFFISIMSIIGGFQAGFASAYIMTGGGPQGSTTTISYYIFQNGFEIYQMGYAAAIAWVLFILVFVVTLINWRYGGKKVEY